MDQSTAPTEARPPESARQALAEYRSMRDGGKSLPEIEEDIVRTRVRLSATIAALERELAPERLLEASTQSLRSALEPRPGPFRQQIWAYAIPLALIATGLGWLITLRRRSYRAEMAPTDGEIPGELPSEVIETDESPLAMSAVADMAGPVEPVSLADEKTAM